MPTELERLLSFSNIEPPPRSVSLRDSQKQKLYSAENRALGGGRLLDSIQDCQALVDMICKSRFWKSLLRRNGKEWMIAERIHCIPTKKGSGVATWCEGERIIRLPKASFKTWIIIHELAHAATPNKAPNHGPEYARTYLQLVKRFMGQRPYERLLAEFRASKIRRSRRTTKKSRFVKGSPEAREYMKALRRKRAAKALS